MEIKSFVGDAMIFAVEKLKTALLSKTEISK